MPSGSLLYTPHGFRIATESRNGTIISAHRTIQSACFFLFRFLFRSGIAPAQGCCYGQDSEENKKKFSFAYFLATIRHQCQRDFVYDFRHFFFSPCHRTNSNQGEIIVQKSGMEFLLATSGIRCSYHVFFALYFRCGGFSFYFFILFVLFP